MNSKKAKVGQILRDLQSAPFICRKIIGLNLELEEMNHRILGLSHNRPTLTKEQERSSLPMPSYHGGYTSPLALLEEISAKEQEVLYYQRRLSECKAIELLDLEDQNMIFRWKFFGENVWDVAADNGYSRRGMETRIRNEIGKLM